MQNTTGRVNMRLTVYLIIILVLECLIFGVLKYAEGYRIESYLDNKNQIYENNFQSTVSSLSQVFTNVVESKISDREPLNYIKGALDDPANRDRYRNWLRVYTQPVFDSLKPIGLTHMQFHLPDGTSFLRMHKPFAYGDSLNVFRTTVRKANAEKKYIEGFENGRLLLAYRFVFPLELDGEHIGSVEMSVSIRGLIEKMNRIFSIAYAYVLEKDKIFKGYTFDTVKSIQGEHISSKYFMAKCNTCELHDHPSVLSEEVDDIIINSVVNTNAERLTRYESFSEVVVRDEDIIFSYLPVVDVNGIGMGYIIAHAGVQGYRDIKFTFRIIFVFLSVGAVSILTVFIIQEYNRRKILFINSQLEKKVDEKVKELQDKELFVAQQSKMATMGEMVGSILHQLKQPINSIAMISDLLLFDCDKKKNKEMYEQLSNIKEQAFFMSQTGDDFRNFMKTSKDKTVFNIAEAVDDVVNLFEFNFSKYSIGFERNYELGVEADANILGYPNELKHVLLNIFNNSRDAIISERERMVENDEDVSEFSGLIIVDILIEDYSVVMKVSDSGGGIPSDVIDKIFEKGFSTKADQGSGIGLFMSREMVEKTMNGTVRVKNILGGAEFCFTFPIAE